MTTKEELRNREYSYDNGFRPRPWNIPKNYQYYNHCFFFILARRIVFVIMILFYFLFSKIKYHLVLCNKENKKKFKQILKKEGGIITSNHVFPNDAPILVTTLRPKLTYILSLQSNMGFLLISRIMRLAGIVPVPEDITEMRNFDNQTIEALNRKTAILFMAEGSLILWSGHVRKFERGAFKYALLTNKKILPVVYTFHAHKNKKGKRPYLKLHYLDPYEIKNTGNKRLDTLNAANELERITNDYFVTHSDPVWLDEQGNKRREELLAR